MVEEWIFEPTQLTMDEVFGFHNLFIMGLLWKEVHMTVHIIAMIIRGGHGFHDVFIKFKDKMIRTG